VFPPLSLGLTNSLISWEFISKIFHAFLVYSNRATFNKSENVSKLNSNYEYVLHKIYSILLFYHWG
jgi:hypothetical protein